MDYDEVIPVLYGTYELLGILNYQPDIKDIQNHVEAMDQNRDGRISLEEYEVFVLKALVGRQQPE